MLHFYLFFMLEFFHVNSRKYWQISDVFSVFSRVFEKFKKNFHCHPRIVTKIMTFLLMPHRNITKVLWNNFWIRSFLTELWVFFCDTRDVPAEFLAAVYAMKKIFSPFNLTSQRSICNKKAPKIRKSEIEPKH